MPMQPACVYLHYEDAAPEFTMKFVLNSTTPKTVNQALASFAQAYAATGHALVPSELTLSSIDGTELGSDDILPSGFPDGSDFIVYSSSKPTPADPTAIEAAPAALEVAALMRHPEISGGSSRQMVYAKEGSAIAASQAKMGENSYYYSVGKNKGNLVAAEQRNPVAVVRIGADGKPLPETTISTYSMIDDESKVKIQIPMAAASTLPAGAIQAVFRDRSFDLKVIHERRCFRLHIPILLEEINQHECTCRKRPGKLLLVLQKRDPSKTWYELRKTKGIGDTEFSKIVPDSGEPVEYTL